MTDQPLRVCFFGTYRINYTRHQILLERLESAGVEVIECHQRLWKDGQERVAAASGAWLRPRFLWRVLQVYAQLIKRYLRIQDHELVLIGYPGHIDVFVARVLCWVKRKPLVWDILLSPYLIAKERKLDRISPITVSGLSWLERLATHLPDLLLLETDAYMNWYSTTYGIPRSRFRIVPLGASKDFQVKIPEMKSHAQFKVLYYGSYLPSHGVDRILEAARLLHDESQIHFELIGDGPEREHIYHLSRSGNLTNITFIPWLEKDQLIDRIAQADICLGAFGDTPHSKMSIQNKIFECMALAKPVITGDSPVLRQLFRHRENIYLVERSNAEALALSIKDLLQDDPFRRSIAEIAYETFQMEYSTEKLGLQLKQYLSDLTLHQRESG